MINDISQNHADIFSYQAAGTGMVRAGLSVRVRQASHLITRARSLSGANAEGWGWSLEMGLRWWRPILKPNLEAQKWNCICAPGLEQIAQRWPSKGEPPPLPEKKKSVRKTVCASVGAGFKVADADKTCAAVRLFPSSTPPLPPPLFQAASLGSRRRAEN